ncbi:MAG: hypothetical protein AB8H86_06875 [Polyangiales bacterium]
MRKEPIPSGEVVDVCECGVFADYFDGDPRALSKLFRLPVPEASKENDDVLTCAGCSERMELLRYEEGPLLHRCHACASVFMTPVMLNFLRNYEAQSKAEEPTLLARLAHWLDSF